MDRAIDISKEKLVYILTKNSTAEIALTIPPINEKTEEIFCTCLVYMIELEDLMRMNLAYVPPGTT